MAARRAANHGGSVYQRKSDGRWVGEIQVGRLENGKPDRRAVYGKTEQEARKKLAEIVRQNDRGSLVAKEKVRETVAGFIEYWLETHNVRPSTKKRYGELLRLHVIPEIGKHRLSALKVEHVRLMNTHLLKKIPERGLGRKPGDDRPLSPQTVKHCYRALHTVLQQAVREDYIGRNVCDSVEPPSVGMADTYTPTRDEVRRLLNSAAEAEDKYLALWMMAAVTGARLGELLGLQWERVNLETGAVSIERTLLQTTRNGVPVFGKPKSERSRRVVSVPAAALPILKEHRRQQLEQRIAVGEGYAANDLVFATHTGTPLSHRNMLRAFKVALKRAGLPEAIRIHDLRHAAVTILMQEGGTHNDAALLAGHQSPGFTVSQYGDARQERIAENAARVGRALFG